MFNPLRRENWLRFGKRHWWSLMIGQAAVLFAAGIFVAWYLFAPNPTSSEPGNSPAATSQAHQHEPSGAAETIAAPQWWTCAMHPQIRQQKPGKCPICQMELVAVTPSAGGLRTLTIKPAVKQLMKVETMPVERKYVTAKIRMVGKVEYDETRLAHITAWVAGRLDRLYVDYAGIQVNQGDHMVYIYSEELYSIQEELIQAVRFQRDNPNQRTGRIDLAEGAREKLRLLGLTERQIQEIEQRDKAEDHLTIYSPAGGIVIEKLKQIGDRVRTGDRIYTIADLRQVWVLLDAYESDLIWLRYGQKVSFTTDAYPGETFAGRVAFIDPVLNKATRTIKVRVNVDNHDGRLKPEMFVRAVVESNVAAGGRVMDAELAGKWISPMHPEIVKDAPGICDVCGMPLVRAETLGYVAAEVGSTGKPLVIPRTAALVTGTRAIVYVEVEGAKEPTYEGREVLLGPRAGDYYLVRNGVHEGEMVVTNGNFKIDSALQIQAKPTMMTPQGGGGGGGHDHGGGSSTTGADKDKASALKTMELPEGFKSQLHELVTLSQAVSSQVKLQDVESAQTAFGTFSQALNRVNAEGLSDHAPMLWKEFLMLLGNDAVEGSAATDLSVASRVENSLRDNIRRMREEFMLSHRDPSSTTTSVLRNLELSDAFKAQLSAFLATYLQLQTALAEDKFDAAVEAGTSIKEALSAIDAESLNEAAKEAWSIEQRPLDEIVRRLGAAKNISDNRKEFALLSEQSLVLAQKFGVAADTTLFELHCPMAFDGRGATWLQDNDQPKNPYFGLAMLTCADRVRRIETLNPGDAKEKGHQHE